MPFCGGPTRAVPRACRRSPSPSARLRCTRRTSLLRTRSAASASDSTILRQMKREPGAISYRISASKTQSSVQMGTTRGYLATRERTAMPGTDRPRTRSSARRRSRRSPRRPERAQDNQERDEDVHARPSLVSSLGSAILRPLPLTDGRKPRGSPPSRPVAGQSAPRTPPLRPGRPSRTPIPRPRGWPAAARMAPRTHPTLEPQC